MMKFMRYQKGICIGIFLIIALLLSTIGYLTYSEIKNVVIQGLGESAEKVAVTAAHFIEEDMEPYKALSETSDYQSDNYDQAYYQKMNELFQNIREETGASYIFTAKKLSDTQSAYILDGEDPESEFFSPIGSTDQLVTMEGDVFRTGMAGHTDFFEGEKWGSYISGYAPIRDPETGEVLSVVGVDFSRDAITVLMKNIKQALVVGISVLIMLTSFIIFKLIWDRFEAENIDYLTELHSKRYHDKQLADFIEKARNSECHLFLMMIDIDFFKEINDEYGHDIGDQVLKYVACTIKKNARKTDICSRFGGDEFVLILSDISKEQAGSIAKRIMSKLRKSPVVLEDVFLESGKITISIGIAEWKKEMENQNLTQYADEALYLSKGKGRNQITIYDGLSELI
ncbi:diguanylate cyclase [Acetobacterium paludosum]|uniref:Diguanylate cyclase n=1 Tax=Acetobacterium paludosum TaxID=52693 RepID=A0A923HXW7_9FIRM|nr:GGDEF domain-containing protein [Acetobacterium paludosum]MBC3888011.1 diguanylate cyclase [Acetobacterium paludosum]